MPAALQLCPNDHPPFVEVCAGHARALAVLGYRVHTVFFESRGFAPPSTPAAPVDFAAIDDLPAIVRHEQPTLLISHRYRAYRAAARLARRLPNPAHIAVAHEFGLFARHARRWRRRLAGDGDTRFAGVSDAVAEDLRAAGVASPVVLPNPIDADALRRQLRPRADARAELGLSATDFAIGVIGRLHPKKDPRRALRAFKRVQDANRNARLVFLGDGELRAELERDAGTRVLFAGFRGDVRGLLGALDAVLACATAQEAFGLSLLEALTADVPVICADRLGPRFVLGDCGVYFDSDSDLDAALKQAWQLGFAGDAARRAQRVERLFSIDALAGRYRELLDRCGPGSPQTLC